MHSKEIVSSALPIFTSNLHDSGDASALTQFKTLSNISYPEHIYLYYKQQLNIFSKQVIISDCNKLGRFI